MTFKEELGNENEIIDDQSLVNLKFQLYANKNLRITATMELKSPKINSRAAQSLCNFHKSATIKTCCPEI